MGVGELHDYVLFAVNTGFRPNEASNRLIGRLEEACPSMARMLALKATTAHYTTNPEEPEADRIVSVTSISQQLSVPVKQ
jgi:hypothetical protein